ncbi:MAG: DUF6067 family protein [Armatimonadota bacterium]|nr:DUF6067 family protein [Armatimonadota bacterium]
MSARRPYVQALLLLAWLAPAGAQQETGFADMMSRQQRRDHVQAWARYAFIGIPRATGGPVVDGQVGVREWGCSAQVAHALQMSTGVAVPDMVQFQLCYTSDTFFVSFRVERPESARVPSSRDFFELLLDVEHDHDRYRNIAATLEEILWHGIGPNLDRSAWSPDVEYVARTTWFGWEGELAIPFVEFGLDGPPEPGTVWGIDLLRNERTPTDRLAQVGWRSTWAATKDLAHMAFLGRPLAVRVEEIGWMPGIRQIGARVAVTNFSDQPVSLDGLVELRQAARDLPMGFLPAVDSALTEDLDAAIGSNARAEVQTALAEWTVLERQESELTVPARTTQHLGLARPDEPGDYLVSLAVRDDEALLAAMTVPFVVTVPLDVSVKSYLFSASAVDWTVDLRRVQDLIGEGTALSVAASPVGGAETVDAVRQDELGGLREVSGTLRFDATPGGSYEITAALRRGEEELARSTTALSVPQKPEWIGNQIGRSRLIPPPWGPLQADEVRTQSLTVGYDWSKPAVLPAIIVNDRALLAGPARLVLSDAEGQEQLMAVDRFELVESDDLHAVYEIGAAAGHLGRVRATVTVEFDGFAWWDVTLEPHEDVTLGGCRLEVPLRPEYARLYTRGRMTEGLGDTMPRDSGVGRLPAEGLELPYVFQVWMGSVEAGLQFYCESARNWHNADDSRAIRVIPGADSVTLQVRFVDRPVEVQGPMDWHFGLMPTPATTRDGGLEDHAYFQLGGVPAMDPPDEELQETDPRRYRELQHGHDLVHSILAERGVKAVILFSSYNDVFGYPGVRDPDKRDKLRRFVELMHSQGIKVLVYAGWGISTEAPEWERFGSELVNLPLRNSGYGTYWASPVSLFPDLFVYRLAEHIRQFDLDGIYMDSTTSISGSLHPNGMRWTDEAGNRRGSYPVRAMRDFTRRIYRVLNGEVIEDGIFYNHHSPPANACVENFVTVRCPSEFAQFHEGPLDDAFIDYFVAKNGGVPFGYHTELTNKNWMSGIEKSIAELYSVALPLQVSFKAVNFAPWATHDYSRMAQPMHVVWDAMAWVDSSSAQYLPWWDNEDYISIEPTDGTLSAIWLQPGERALVCVSNLPDQERELTVRLDLERMGLGDATVEDAIVGESVPLTDGTVTVTIEPQRWRLWKVQGGR